MTAITKMGRWWEPQAEERAQPGVLRIQEDGSASLELIGGFDLRTIEPHGSGYAVAAGSRDLDTLFGECEGEPITLFRSLELESRGSFFSGAPTFQRLHVHRVILGAHIEAEDTPSFRSAAFEIENLTAFLAAPTFAYDRSGAENSAAFAETHPETVEIDGWKITADRATEGFNYANTRGGVRVEGEARAVIRATPTKPTSLEEFDSLALELTDLVTLAAGDACGLIRLRLELTEKATSPVSSDQTIDVPIWVESFGQRIHTARPDTATTNAPIFTCGNKPFSETIANWLPLRRKASNACNVFFGTEYSPGGFMETRLISIGIAAEALHAALYGDATEMPAQDFQRIKETMLGALEDEAERAWVKHSFHNRPTLRQRLRQLAKVPAAGALGLLIENIEEWISWFITARNGITHRGGGVAPEYRQVRIGQTLIRLVLLAELGLSERDQEEAIRRLTGNWV